MTRFTVAVVLLAVAVMVGLARPGGAEQRVALVIGNGAYRFTDPLANPPNDARLIAETLAGLGFEVAEHVDLDQRAMKRAIQDFGDRLRQAGDDGVGVFYYAGHGVQVDGVNYLIPIDARIRNEGDVDIEAVSANAALATVAFAGNRLNFVILDACRNNPFGRGFRSPVRGLAQMNAPTGTLVSYATAPGDVASDGVAGSGNSPFAVALAERLIVPGVPAELMFRDVRVAVLESTDGAQTPWDASSLTGDFFFNPEPVAPPLMAIPPRSRPVDREALFWQSIEGSDDADDFREYLRLFPRGMFGGLARNRLEALEAATVDESEPRNRRTQSTEPEDAALAAAVPPPQAPPALPPPVAGEAFKDCGACPEMVALAIGTFVMGSPATERGRWRDEEPRHTVRVDAPFAIARYEITRAEFARFAVATGHEPRGCHIFDGDWHDDATKSWREPGFPQDDRHPAVCVSWHDALAYAQWLSQLSGYTYRLPSEAEWEYAARAKTETARFWGAGADDACGYANVADRALARHHTEAPAHDCSDRRVYTAPVGGFEANGFGLYDMLGNAWEWTGDCWHDSYAGAPSDARVWVAAADCRFRVLRGGAWGSGYRRTRSAIRYRNPPETRDSAIGFRLVRTLTE